MISSVEMARRWPVTAARVVLKPGTDHANSWSVLAAAYDEKEALRLVRLAALDLSDGDRRKADALITSTLTGIIDHLL
ncbi:hypothetical protein [Nonomuraea sp. NPDC023979]|uniref:hypothetical protein n=1 Tax=Nonomuraea sp. NPDC023979 TaxID=3154796 RepID=UPI0033FA136D